MHIRIKYIKNIWWDTLENATDIVQSNPIIITSLFMCDNIHAFKKMETTVICFCGTHAGSVLTEISYLYS